MTLPALLLALVLAAPASPAPVAGPKAAKVPKVLQYLSPGEVDAARILPPPPADGSPRGLEELAELRRIAATASPARLAQAHWDDEHEDPSMFTPTLGAGFDMKALPATAALLAAVQTDAGVSASAAKTLFKRKRPWVLDAGIKTCDPNDKPLTSYPSGHATLGYSLAMTLAVVMPERAQALMARASDYAYSREVCGSHFASDTQASEALAAAMVTSLLSKPDFRAKLDLAREELAGRRFEAN